MSDRVSRDTVRRIWDDENGTRIDVRPDGDALGLLEVVYVDESGKSAEKVTMTKAQARLVAAALLEAADEPDLLDEVKA